MRFIKLALISLVVLSLLILGMSLLIPSHVRISRAVNITAPKDSLVLQLSDLRNWKQWNALVNNPDMTNSSYSNNAVTSDKVQVLLKTVKTDTIFTQWNQQGGREIASAFTLHVQDNTAVVQWYFDFQLKWYPWEKFGSIIFDKQLGPPMEYSLATLKKLLEKTP
jgi:hypothetical protein